MTDLRILHADGSEEGQVLHTEEDVKVIPRGDDIIRIGGYDYEIIEYGTYFVKVGDRMRVTVTVNQVDVEEEADEVPTE